MINLIIADDQELFLEGLHLLLTGEEDISIIGEAKNGREVLDLVMRQKPDVVITDIQMPEMDGVELTRVLQESYPEIRVIGLTMYQEDHWIVDMLEAGARGYLFKDSSKEKLIEAIRVVCGNGRYFCETTSVKLLKKIAGSKVPVSRKELARFTDTEIKIIQLVCQQLSSREIGEQIYLGVKTVESYRNKIFDKMGVKNMAGMVIYAIQCGLFKP
jgi:DNA-binding NarL/FixJ family response regulator